MPVRLPIPSGARALRLDAEQLLSSRFPSWTGRVGCLFLAFRVDPAVRLTGPGLIAVGLVWHGLRRG